MRRVLRVACLVMVFAVLHSRAVLAAEAPRAVVRIIVAGRNRATIDLLLARLARAWKGLDAVIVTSVVPAMALRDVLAPRAAGDKASVWIDLSAQAATLFVVDAGNVFERKLSFEQGFDNVALELLDVVTTDAVQAVLAGEHLGVTRQEFTRSIAPHGAPSPSPTAPNAARAARRPGFVLGLGYQGTLLAPHRFAHGPSIETQLEWPGVLVGIELRGRFPYRVNDAGETLSLASQGMRLSVGVPISVERRLRCVLSVAGGIDVTRIHATSSDANVDSPPPFWSLTPVISPSLQVQYSVEKFRAALVLGADVDPWETSYVLASPGSSVPIWTPWRVRPVAGAALSYAF